MLKKIAVYHNLPYGGGLRTIEEFSKRLSQKYILDLYTIDGGSHSSSEKNYFRRRYSYNFNGLTLIKGGLLLRPQEDYNFFVKLVKLHKNIAEDIDKREYSLVILSHDVYIQTPYISRFLKTKTLYYCQEPWRNYYEYNLNLLNKEKASFKRFYLLISDYLRKLSDINNARRVNKILVNSYSSLESVFRAYGIYGSVCHLGVDLNVFKPLRRQKENYVFVVGNLSVHKGHEFVIDALSLLKTKERPQLFIASGGVGLDRRDYLENYGSSRNVNVKIFPQISEKDIVDLYSRARIVICAAHLETLGLSALEAIACETPVIAVKEGGYRDMIVDGVNGLFIDRNEAGLARAIRQLLTDSSLYNRIAKHSRKSLYPYWTWDAAEERLEEYIKRLIK
ncbi:MAG: glycosyltransferase family 4 protein [Patescibacteria group bacterium]